MFENDSILETVLSAIEALGKLIWEVLYGMIGVAIGYFLPIKDMVNFIILLFILDVAFGYWKARIFSGPKFNTPLVKFSTAIIWKTTVPRMALSILLLMLTLKWDTTFKQETFSTYNTVGWFISGMLIISIGKNGFKITGWEVFSLLTGLFQNKIKEQTGIDVNNIDTK